MRVNHSYVIIRKRSVLCTLESLRLFVPVLSLQCLSLRVFLSHSAYHRSLSLCDSSTNCREQCTNAGPDVSVELLVVV